MASLYVQILIILMKEYTPHSLRTKYASLGPILSLKEISSSEWVFQTTSFLDLGPNGKKTHLIIPLQQSSYIVIPTGYQTLSDTRRLGYVALLITILKNVLERNSDAKLPHFADSSLLLCSHVHTYAVVILIWPFNHPFVSGFELRVIVVWFPCELGFLRTWEEFKIQKCEVSFVFCAWTDVDPFRTRSGKRTSVRIVAV